MEGKLTVSMVTGALLHFKFLHDFHGRAKEEAGREEHFDAAREYKLYNKKLNETNDLNLFCENSVRYRSSEQLLHGKIIRTSAEYDAYACTCMS
jgi:hypothetical protein